MSIDSAVSLLRSVLSGSAPVRPSTPPIGHPTFYFRLQIAEGGAADPLAATGRHGGGGTITLRRGGRYTVSLVAGTHGTREETPLQVANGSRFELVYGEASGVGIIEPRFQVDGVPTFASLSRSFQVEVPADAPAEQGEFQLMYSPPIENSGHQVCVARLSVLLDGFSEQDAEVLRAAYVKTDKPPAATAILHVLREGEMHVRLRGGADSPQHGWLRLDSVLEAPPADLGELVTWRVDPSKVLQLMMKYSRADTVPLQEWLSDVVETYRGEDLKLVICDHTDLGTPWEMLTMAGDDMREVWLGAEFAVSRWMPINYYRYRRNLDFSLEPPKGDALVYIDEQELHATGEELAAVEALSLTRSSTLSELWGALKESLAELGLIYLASHGTFSTDGLKDVLAGRIAVGSETHPENRITVLKFEGLGWHDDPRPLVFVNACHSARVLRIPRLSASLPEALLSRVAGAYIGTLGPVGSQYASEVAGRFLRLAAREDGVWPARFLRDLRAEAVAACKAEESPENSKRLVFAFSYVMYGNPLARLRLRAGREKGCP